MVLAKTYRDDEYYTTKETAKKFFELVVKPSGILKHKTLLMPFTTLESPLYIIATQYHDHIIAFTGDMDLWKKIEEYEDVAVVDNPPFSLSTPIEKYYFSKDIPFVLFRSAVSYPKFIYKQDKAGIIYENSTNGITFSWGRGLVDISYHWHTRSYDTNGQNKIHIEYYDSPNTKYLDKRTIEHERET